MRKSPLHRLFVGKLASDPLSREPRWMQPVEADIKGLRLRFTTLVVPSSNPDVTTPVFHVFVDRGTKALELPGVGLSDRETETVRLVASGLTYAEAATELGVATETVRTFVKRAFLKLRVSSREDLLKLVMRRPRP
jgi:DNA-binding CsgD family transcriptional regulator